MSQCEPVSTPIATSGKLCADAGSPCDDPTLYCSLASALQYLTFTRPDISYAVQQVCLHIHDPRAEHMGAIHRILQYIQVHLIMICTYISLLFPNFYHIPMMIGVVVLTPAILILVIVLS